MPATEQPIEISDSLTLPADAPLSIQIGAHVGRRETVDTPYDPPTYRFSLQNGHALSVTFNPESSGVDVRFLTAARQERNGADYGVVLQILTDAAEENSPSVAGAGIDFRTLSLPNLRAEQTAGQQLRDFASGAAELSKAIDAQALRFARAILGKIPAELREWVNNYIIFERTLATQLKVYGTQVQGPQGPLGEHQICSTHIDPDDHEFGSKAALLRKLGVIKEAWKRIFVVEIEEIEHDRITVRIRPLPPKES